MPLPYCCHLISSIELTYSSDTRIPRPILRAFKHPRIDSSNGNYTAVSKDDVGTLEALADDITICNRLLESHGYCLAPDNPYEDKRNGSLRIKKLENHPGGGGCCTNKRNRERRGSDRSRFHKHGSNGGKLHEDSVLSQIVDIVKRSMVYYICLFDDYTQDFEHLISKSNQGSNETYRIRKNSIYEMLCALKDCLLQLKHNGTEHMEAVLITDEYSGIFTHEEVLITRSTMAFRRLLASEAIKCYSVYEDISSSMRMSSDEENDLNESKLMTDYLKVSLPSKEGESKDDVGMELALINYADKPPGSENINVSKTDFFKSLNLPIPEDDDMNLFCIKGRSGCAKLLSFLEKQCTSNLLKMKSADLKSTPVKFVLTNFPVIFAKLQEMRVSSHESKVEAVDAFNVLAIKGLVLPSVLNGMFKAIRRMQASGMMKDIALNVTYNTEIDAELHDPSLQISERNRLYSNFIANMNSLERSDQPKYRILRKMVPFKNFLVHKGKITVSSKGALKVQSPLALSQYPSDGESHGGKVMYLADMPRGYKYLRDATHSLELGMGQELVILKDTLYTNLSSIMFTTMHLEGASGIATMPTKTLVDESLSNVCWTDSGSASMHPYTLKCYVDLYPMVDKSEPNTLLEVVQPYHLVNLVWMMNYLLHAGGFVPFADRESFMESISEQVSDQDSLVPFLSMSRSHADDISRMTETDLSHLFNADVSSTRDDPLAQQSYVLMLVHHIRFNKRFQSLFGRPYLDYYRERLQDMRHKNTKSRKVRYDSGPDTRGDTGLDVVQLTNSWHSLLQRVQSEASIADIIEASPSDVTKGELSTAVEEISSEDADLLNYDLPLQKMNEDTDNLPSGFRNMFQAITGRSSSGGVDDAYLGGSSIDSFHSVSSATRAHGRVHHCIFDFDAKVPFKDKDDRSKFQQEIEHMYNPNKNNNHTPRPVGKRHVVFVFLTGKVVTSLECSRIKLIKDMLNSSHVTFIHEEQMEDEFDFEDKALNAESFIRKFKSECVASAFGEYYVKAGVSYSFVTNVERLDRHLCRLFQMFGDGVVYDLYYTDLDIDKDFEYLPSMLSQVTSMDSGAKTRHPGKTLHEHFVGYSWLCDAYFNGAIDLQEEIDSIHKLPIHETVKGSAQRGNNALKCKMTPNDAGHLGFNALYEEVKFLWGWYIYVLHGKDASISADDALLYRRHCGIHISSHKSMALITQEVVHNMRDHLERFKLSEEDVSTFMSYPRIYTNTVVLVGDDASHGSEREMVSKELDESAGIIRITFGGKVICFGGYEGIPLLKSTWLIDTLRNARPEPLSNYVVS